MAGRHITEEKEAEMRSLLEALQDAFPYTIEGLLLFAQTIINTLIVGRPDLNRMQGDILKFLYGGNQFRMIMAQRG